MKQVTLQFNFEEDLRLSEIVLLRNTTGFESDYELAASVCAAGLKAYEFNKYNFNLHDELRKLGITGQNG